MPTIRVKAHQVPSLPFPHRDSSASTYSKPILAGPASTCCQPCEVWLQRLHWELNLYAPQGKIILLVCRKHSEYNSQGALHPNEQFGNLFFKKPWCGVVTSKARRLGGNEEESEDSGHPCQGAVLLAPRQMPGISGSGTQKAGNLKDEMRWR